MVGGRAVARPYDLTPFSPKMWVMHSPQGEGNWPAQRAVHPFAMREKGTGDEGLCHILERNLVVGRWRFVIIHRFGVAAQA